MEKKYEIIITNGQGTANVMNGSYTVESTTNGYVNTSIDPNTLTVAEGTDTYELKIAAEGTLRIHVTETGEETGTPIVGATFIRCDSDGNTYGNPITTNELGICEFSNVPYDSVNTIPVYFKQTASDTFHIFDDTLKNESLSTITKTIEVTNALPPVRTFTLTDTNYDGLKITNGTLSLNQ